MNKCVECGKEFKSHQGMLSHVRAIHQGIKVGGNPNYAEFEELRLEREGAKEIASSLLERVSELEQQLKRASPPVPSAPMKDTHSSSGLGSLALILLGLFALSRAEGAQATGPSTLDRLLHKS